MTDDHASVGLSAILSESRPTGGLIYLSGSGADETISDYSIDGEPVFCHSCFRGVFPANLSDIFPWCSFYKARAPSASLFSFESSWLLPEPALTGSRVVLSPACHQGTQRNYLMKEELIAGAHGVEGRSHPHSSNLATTSQPTWPPPPMIATISPAPVVSLFCSHRCATGYPFLNPKVVQEYLWLTPELKNSEYKRPVADYLRASGFPNAWKAKIGFSVLPQQPPTANARAGAPLATSPPPVATVPSWRLVTPAKPLLPHERCATAAASENGRSRHGRRRRHRHLPKSRLPPSPLPPQPPAASPSSASGSASSSVGAGQGRGSEASSNCLFQLSDKRWHVVYATDRQQLVSLAASLASLLTSAYPERRERRGAKRSSANPGQQQQSRRIPIHTLVVTVVVPPQDELLTRQLVGCVERSVVPGGVLRDRLLPWSVRVRTLDDKEMVALGFPPLSRMGASAGWLAQKGNLGAASNFARFFLPQLLSPSLAPGGKPFTAPPGDSDLVLYLDVDVIVTCDVFGVLDEVAPHLFLTNPHAVIAAVEQHHNPNLDFVLPSAVTDTHLAHARRLLSALPAAERLRFGRRPTMQPPKTIASHLPSQQVMAQSMPRLQKAERDEVIDHVDFMERFLRAPSFNAGVFVANLTRWHATNATGRLLAVLWAHVGALEGRPQLLASLPPQPPPDPPPPPPPPPPPLALHECRGPQAKERPACVSRMDFRRWNMTDLWYSLLSNLFGDRGLGPDVSPPSHHTPWRPGAVTSQSPMLIVRLARRMCTPCMGTSPP